MEYWAARAKKGIWAKTMGQGGNYRGGQRISGGNLPSTTTTAKAGSTERRRRGKVELLRLRFRRVLPVAGTLEDLDAGGVGCSLQYFQGVFYKIP